MSVTLSTRDRSNSEAVLKVLEEKECLPFKQDKHSKQHLEEELVVHKGAVIFC